MSKYVTIWVHGHVLRLASIQRQTLKFMPKGKKSIWTLVQELRENSCTVCAPNRILLCTLSLFFFFPGCTKDTCISFSRYWPSRGAALHSPGCCFCLQKTSILRENGRKIEGESLQILSHFPWFSVRLQHEKKGLLWKDYLLMYICDFQPVSCLLLIVSVSGWAHLWE